MDYIKPGLSRLLIVIPVEFYCNISWGGGGMLLPYKNMLNVGLAVYASSCLVIQHGQHKCMVS